VELEFDQIMLHSDYNLLLLCEIYHHVCLPSANIAFYLWTCIFSDYLVELLFI